MPPPINAGRAVGRDQEHLSERHGGNSHDPSEHVRRRPETISTVPFSNALGDLMVRSRRGSTGPNAIAVSGSPTPDPGPPRSQQPKPAGNAVWKYYDDGIDYSTVRPSDGPVVEHRRCTTCELVKPWWEFGRHRRTRKSGVRRVLKSQCRACLAAREKARRAEKKAAAEA